MEAIREVKFHIAGTDEKIRFVGDFNVRGCPFFIAVNGFDMKSRFASKKVACASWEGRINENKAAEVSRPILILLMILRLSICKFLLNGD